MMHRLLQRCSSSSGSSGEEEASGENSTYRETMALRLCKEEGLLRESVTEKNGQGETRIMVAAADDWKPTHIRLLVATGADVNERMESDGSTPIMNAATCGHTTTLKELAELGADVNAADNNGDMAVMFEASGGHTATVKELWSLEADVKAATNRGKTAIMFAPYGGHTATVKALAVKSVHEVHVFKAKDPLRA